MKQNKIIYLDNAATTKPSEEVVVLNDKLNSEYFGNSSSIHGLGVESLSLLNKARKSIQKSLGVTHRVIFTSGATESNNIAIKGYALKYKNRGNHLITTTLEHPSVLECFKQLEEFGFSVTYLKPNSEGIITPEILEKVITDNTILVSIMAVNNEVGFINPIESLAKLIKKYPKIKFHVDATQAISKTNINYSDVDMFTFSGHKLHGIKGSGALLVKPGIELMPIISGGGQEEGLRSGTVSLANAITLAKALEGSKYSKNVENLNSCLRDLLKDNKHIVINSNSQCTPYIFNFSLLDKKASVVVEALSLRNIYISSVSACHSKYEAASYVVKEVTNDDKRAANTLRVSFDNSNTIQEVDEFVNNLNEVLESIK